MGNCHQMIVDHVGKVIGRKTVGLQQHALVQIIIVNFNIAVNFVMEVRFALFVDRLADGIGLAGGNSCPCLFQRQPLARVLKFGGNGVFFRFVVFRLVFRRAETIMGTAQLNQLVGIFGIDRLSFRLDVRSVAAADIRPLVPIHANGFQGRINNVGCAFDIALLVGIFNPKQKIAAGRFGDQIFVQSGAQVADMHITGRRRRKSGSCFHFFPHKINFANLCP